MLTQEEVTEKRKQYMNHELTHQDYYIWLSDGLRIPENLIPSPTLVEKSTDEYFNDVPLRLWDNQHGIVRSYARNLSWSLCDSVCCLKALARRKYRTQEVRA